MKPSNKKYISVYDFKAMMALKDKLHINKDVENGDKEDNTDRESGTKSVGEVVEHTSEA